MATLNNTRISDTYHGLIKTLDNTAISATLKQLSDGDGNVTGLYLNNAGDFKVTAILEFGSLKDTAENIVISKFVDAADGIGNNNNDTSIPTSKAIIDYVAGQITAEDLDFRGDDSTVLGDVDLNSQAFIILGTANEIETSVTSAGGNTLKIGIPSNPVLTGIVTATTFSGDLNGTINTATTATTQSAGDNSTKVATTAYVDTLDAASDLDFSGDSGTGDVTLNTQTFAITGTTNQVTTSASNETLNISLPSTVHRNLQGNVVGNLTGNVTGNVSGDLTGNVTATSVLANGVTATTQASSDNSTKVATTAYVKGLDNASDLDITDGTTSGDVNLNTQSLSILGTASQVVSTVSNQSVTLSLPSSINVNSASATILQNARDISLTGEASGTISSFNGSANVSGAVTLNNDSVTGKVLTGLASPTATNILASDSILQAFGKTQSQLNTLAGGLRFMGTWNATTNSPTLASGGGEADSGTTTGTATNKLIQSSQNFTSTVTNGDQVVNQASGATALVTNVDSNTQLTLDADIMVSGQEYTIDNSPFLSQGHYFVVSVGGTQSLNGLSNWAVGDWVIAGATNTWEKLDHTQVDGTGTVGNITKWSSTNVIADSIMAESGSTISVTGSIAATQLLSSGGNFAVNTNKFTANATSGNVAFTGDLSINTNKFTVNATSGNTLAAGTITSPTFLGDLNGTINTLTTAVTQSANNNSTKVATTAYVDTSAGLYLPLAGGTLTGGLIGTSATFTGNVDLKSNAGNATKYLRIWNEGTAANDDALITWQTQGSRSYSLGIHRDSGSLTISNVNASVASGELITIDNSGNSTFAGSVSATGIIFANKTLEVLGQNLTHGASRIKICQENTNKSQIRYYGADASTKGSLEFTATTSDGSSSVTPLSIDSSGNSTFAGNVEINKASNPTSLRIGNNLADDPFIYFNTDGADFSLGIDRSDSNKFKICKTSSLTGSDVLTIDSSGDVTISNSAVAKLKFNPLGSTYGAGFDVLSVTGTSSAPYTSTISFSNYGSADALKIIGANSTFAGSLTSNAGLITSTSGGDSFLISKSTSATGRGFIKSIGDTGSVLFSAVYGSSSTDTLFSNSLTRAAVIVTTSDTTTHPTSLLIGTFTSVPLVLGTNNVERLKIDGSGNSTFSGNVQIDGGAGNTLTLRKGTGQAALAYGGTTGDEAICLVEGKTGGGLKWYIGTGTLASPTWTAGMELYDGGRLYPYGGVFLGSSNNSNLLDDYEEDTFTPVLKFNGATTGITYSTQAGVYTKVGRQVNFSVEIRLSNKGSATGTCTIEGLPFTSANITGNYGSCMISYSTAITIESGTHFTIDQNSAIIRPRFMNGTFSNNYGSGQFENNSTLILTGSYQSA